MATLQNTSGADINVLTLKFTLSAGGTDSELAGYGVYYSLTGAANSWQRVGLYGTTGVTSVDVALAGAWASNALLYFMWMDDNANGSTDNWYGLDDVSFIKATPQANMLTFGLPGNQATIAGTNITLYVLNGTDVTNFGPLFTTSAGATCYDADPSGSANVISSGAIRNFTFPVHYWVRSSDGLITTDYTVTVIASDSAIVWNTGSGNWDFSASNWLGQSSGLPMLFINGDNVVFNNAAGGTITITPGMAPASTTVSADSGTYTFSGQPLTGTGSLNKSGDGLLVLTSANTFTGSTTVTGGRVQLGNAQALQYSAYDTTRFQRQQHRPRRDRLRHADARRSQRQRGLGVSDDRIQRPHHPHPESAKRQHRRLFRLPCQQPVLTLTKSGLGTQELNGATTVDSLKIGIGAEGGSIVVGSGGSVSVGSGPSSKLDIAYNTSGGGTLANSGTLDASLASSFVANVGTANIGTAGNYSVANYGRLYLGADNVITASTLFWLGGSYWDFNSFGVLTTPNNSSTTIHTPTMRMGCDREWHQWRHRQLHAWHRRNGNH